MGSEMCIRDRDNYTNGNNTGPYYGGRYKEYWDAVPDSALKTPKADGTETQNARMKDYCTSHIIAIGYGSKGKWCGTNNTCWPSMGQWFTGIQYPTPARREEYVEWCKSWVNWLNDTRIGQVGHSY